MVAGKFRVERLIGQGGMGAVYAAEHLILRQRVALKLVVGEASARDEVVRRFFDEARAASLIQSEHIARVIDVGRTETGVLYMVLEYLEGADLARLARDERIPAAAVVDYVLQALDALAHAHALGVVHRDLKPANIFLARAPDGTARIKVLDFGISKLGQLSLAPSAATATAAVMGSPTYMSPEQIKSAKKVDARADIWSIGVVLYELLTGVKPFDGETWGELFAAILQQAPLPPTAHDPSIPPALEAAVLRCLEREPSNRFADVGELA